MEKLKTCLIGKTEDELIDIISSKSDRYGDKLIDFLNKNNLTCLQEATIEQLQNYIKGEFENDVGRIQK